MKKVITFFNEKGGTGKTTLTALFSSYLAYKLKQPVFVMDMDYPSYQMYNIRQTDIEILQNEPAAPLNRFYDGSAPYPVGKTAGQDSFTPAQLDAIERALRKQLDGEGYFLIDFPGRFLPNDPVYHLVSKGLIDLVVFPIDTDRQSCVSALTTDATMRRISKGRQRTAFLWNKEATSERRRGTMDAMTRQLRDRGLTVIDGHLRDIIIARRDARTFGFIRNSVCWPQANINKACGYIEEIFDRIKALVDNQYS